MHTFGWMIVRSPMRAPRPTDENGPTETSRPSTASGAIALSVATPDGGCAGAPNIDNALANARYGCAVRSIAHGAAGAFSPMMTADARVRRSAGA